MASRRVIGIACAAALCLAAAGAAYWSFGASPDPFGTPRQMRASLSPDQRAMSAIYSKEYSSTVAELLTRLIATNGQFRGDPHELWAFLNYLDQISGALDTRSVLTGDDRTVAMVAVAAISRAWYAHGPYRDDRAVELSVLRDAIKITYNKEFSVAGLGATLVKLLDEKWPTRTPRPAELTRVVSEIEASPALKFAAEQRILAMKQGDLPKPTPEETARAKKLIAEWRPLE